MFRKNTASQFIHCQGVDATTGGIKSGVSWTVRRCIDGTFAAATGTATEDGTTGWYKFAMSQADTNGSNIGFNFTGTGAVPQTVNIVTDGSPPDVNLKQILGTALTETAGQIAAAFKKLFDVAAPVLTATSVNQTGDAYARLGAPVGASISADIAAEKVDTAAIKVQTDKLVFTVANQVDVNVIDWKSATAPAMTGDAYARLGAPVGASISADVAAAKSDTAAIKVQTDKLVFTVANQVDVNVIDWKSATAPAMTGDAFARIGAAGAGLTALGDTRIAHLDADVSTRLATSGYTAPDNADIATILTDTAAIKTQTDKLTFTVANQIDANVLDWKSAAAPAMTGDAFARIGAAGAGLTALGDTRIAHLDADVSTRLATSGYTAPDNADIATILTDAAAIKVQTDKLVFTVANQVDVNVIDWKSAAAPAMTGDAFARIGAAGAGLTALGDTRIAHLDADVSTRLATSGYTAPDNADIATILTGVSATYSLLGTPAGASIAADIAEIAAETDNIAAVKAKTDNLPALPAAVSDIPTANANADALLDRANGVETGTTFRQWLRLAAAVLFGKSSGVESTSAVFRDTNDTKDRVSATLDGSGDRTAVTLDPS